MENPGSRSSDTQDSPFDMAYVRQLVECHDKNASGNGRGKWISGYTVKGIGNEFPVKRLARILLIIFITVAFVSALSAQAAGVAEKKNPYVTVGGAAVNPAAIVKDRLGTEDYRVSPAPDPTAKDLQDELKKVKFSKDFPQVTVCQSKSIALTDYLRRKGYEVKFVDGNPGSDGKPTHSWVIVKCTDGWHIVETRYTTTAGEVIKERGLEPPSENPFIDGDKYQKMKAYSWDSIPVTKDPLKDKFWQHFLWEEDNKPVLVGVAEPATYRAQNMVKGVAIFYPRAGFIKEFEAQKPPGNDKKSYPWGVFKYKITGLKKGETVRIDISLPQRIPRLKTKEDLDKLKYRKYQKNKGFDLPGWKDKKAGWQWLTQDTDHIESRLKLTDGEKGDSDPEEGTIGDPGGPAIPPDYGDAPDPGDGHYPSLNAGNGARHNDWAYEWLGPSVDGEIDSKQIDADEFDDGVTFLGGSIRVNIRTSGEPGRYDMGNASKVMYLNAWIDYNDDRDWEDEGEKVIGTGSPTGTQMFDGPAQPVYRAYLPPNTWMRIRLDYGENVGLNPQPWTDPSLDQEKGPAMYGEAEDYVITPPGQKLHYDEGLLNAGDPVDTQWHELYPLYGAGYHLDKWEDNGDGELSPSDQIDLIPLQDGVTWSYHVAEVTLTVLAEGMYIEYEGGYELMDETLINPGGTQWHEAYPNWCTPYYLSAWLDNGDGVLSFCDQIWLVNEVTGEEAEYHVDEVATDIIVEPKLPAPPPPSCPKLHYEEGLLPPGNPVCTHWHELWPMYCNYYHMSGWKDNGDGELSPCDSVKLAREPEGSAKWYHVEEVTVTIKASLKPELIDEKYLEFVGGYELIDPTLENPVCTWWHEAYPDWCGHYHLSGWEDNGDGVLSFCDQIWLWSEDTGQMAEYHVDEVATDIIVCQSVATPLFPGWYAGAAAVVVAGGLAYLIRRKLLKQT